MRSLLRKLLSIVSKVFFVFFSALFFGIWGSPLRSATCYNDMIVSLIWYRVRQATGLKIMNFIC